MVISCKDIAKKYRKELLFSHFNYTFNQSSYAILGHNSSGKSTLLKILANALEPTKGSVSYVQEGVPIAKENSYHHVSFCSPEMDLFASYTVRDLMDFHFSIKSCKLSRKELIAATHLAPYMDKQFDELSSGLQQKIKLSLALFSEAEILLLDEPCTNFDKSNILWYQQAIDTYCKNQLIVIASNQQEEYKFCKHFIQLSEYKK